MTYEHIDLRVYTSGMENQLKEWAQSSQDPSSVANTIKGLVLSAASLIIYFGVTFLHITLNATDVANLATNLGLVAGAIFTIYGIVMKAVMWFAKKPTA